MNRLRSASFVGIGSVIAVAVEAIATVAVTTTIAPAPKGCLPPRFLCRETDRSQPSHPADVANPSPAAPPSTDPAQAAQPADPAQKQEEDPNSVHKQCERAAGEALRRALVLLKQRGLLQGDYAVEEMAPITTTVVNPEDLKKETEKKETEKAAEPVEPKVEMTPAISSAMSKLLAAKMEKEEKPGVLSWYKP